MKNLKNIIQERLHINKDTGKDDKHLDELKSLLKTSEKKHETYGDISDELEKMGYEDKSIDDEEIFWWNAKYEIGFEAYAEDGIDEEINTNVIKFIHDKDEYEERTGGEY